MEEQNRQAPEHAKMIADAARAAGETCVDIGTVVPVTDGERVRYP